MDCMGAANGSRQVSAFYSITLICGQKGVKSRPRSDTPIKSNVLLFLLEKRPAWPSLLTSPLLLAVVLDELICQQRQLRTGRGYTACQGAAPAVLFQPPPPPTQPSTLTSSSTVRQDETRSQALCVSVGGHAVYECVRKVSICDVRAKKKCEFRDDGLGVDLVQDCGSLEGRAVQDANRR